MKSRSNRPADPQSSAAGHQGHDRQPVKSGLVKPSGGNPDPSEAATPHEVAARSKEADEMKHAPDHHPDIAHPGPDRYEAEKSKGDAHHNQHETEKDMQKKIEKL